MGKIVLITAPRKTTVSRTAIRKAVRGVFLKTEPSETVKKNVTGSDNFKKNTSSEKAKKWETVTVTFRKKEPLAKVVKKGAIKSNLKKNKLSETVKKSTLKKPTQKH